MQHRNLIEVLERRGSLADKGITFIEGNDREEFLSYKELNHLAKRALAFLQGQGVERGCELVMQIPENKTFTVVFWACILGGIIPIPLSIGKNDDHKQKLFNVWQVLKNPRLIISRDHFTKMAGFASLQGLDRIYALMGGALVDEAGIYSSWEEGQLFNANEHTIALIQFSSGSTGQPKGVVLTHKNIITNIRAIAHAAGYHARDSMLSWMPLTHDMGLIGFHINPLFSGMDQFLMPPALFIRRPALWLDKTHEHRISILGSPNFGYSYLMKHGNIGSEGNNWDLSSVRLIYNGAEPISESSCRVFLKALSGYGLKSRSLRPVYGLAEASLAVSISGLDEELGSLEIGRDKINFGARIAPASSAKEAVSFVNVGKPVNDCSIRITDHENNSFGEEIVGCVQIKGDNVTSAYYQNETETRAAIAADGWLRTGDLGFIKEGSLYITGRQKDILFQNGQNFYPHDVERVAEELEEIELNKIAVGGIFNNESQKEEAIAFVLHKGDPDAFVRTAVSLRGLINDRMGFELDRIIPVKDIPRTTSGKLQRFRLLEQYKNGDFKGIWEDLIPLMEKERADRQSGIEPENEWEEKLQGIWERILKIDSPGLTCKFSEAGGNSLKAAEMAMMLWKECEVEMPLEKIFEKQTIREIAKVAQAMGRKKYMPLPVAPEVADHPLSAAQKRLYYSWMMDRSSIAYNIPVAFEIKGEIDRTRLENCIRQLIGRHDSLRTVFSMDHEPKFQIKDTLAFVLSEQDCSREETDMLLKSFVQPFDIVQGPLFRCELLRTGIGEYVLFADFHHLISDGVSLAHFIGELFELYAGREPQAMSARYKDHVIWERGEYLSGRWKQQEEYWRATLTGALPVLALPVDLQRPVVFDTEGGKLEFEIGREHTLRLKELADAHQCTLHVLLFTVYHILLLKYTGQEDIIIGIPVACRRHPDLQNIQGMFVNNLAIRCLASGDEPFPKLLERQKAAIAGALENQDYPFDDLIRNLALPRDISRNPLFDTMFVYQNMRIPTVPSAGLSISRRFLDPGYAKFDISMEIIEEADSLQCGIEYSTNLFRKGTIERMVSHFRNLAGRIMASPNSKLSELPVITGPEYDEFINRFNATQRDYRREMTMHGLFEEQVKLRPARVALEWEGGKMTYEQLNRQAGRLASLLKTKGVAREGVVGICLPRSSWLLVSILAVWKSGACYLPIEADLPETRKRFLIADSRCRLLIGDKETAPSPELWDMNPDRILNIDKLDWTIEPVIGEPQGGPRDLAYVMYTSGTTGMPKGVMIEHVSLINYISWATENYIRDGQGDFPLFTSIAFDLTVTSLFTPLLTGNRIVIYGEESMDPAIEKVILDNKSDIIKLTPSHLKLLLKNEKPIPPEGIRLKGFIVGGEKLDVSLAKQIFNKFHGKVEIYNEYGPTEATVGCMIHRFNPNEDHSSVAIGIPAGNMQIYILDRYLKPVPAGVHGEIYIAGDGLARGYLYNKDITKEKFVPNPFRKGTIMYKTGDIALRRPDGLLEYIGRSDQQVKISGYRIELSEIADQLRGYDGVLDALVMPRSGDQGQQRLYAYYMGTTDIGEHAFKNYLASRLPHYMIPLRYTRVPDFPLTKNGKINYDALPQPVTDEVAEERPMAENETESLFLTVWKEILGQDNIGVTDNFFELGGDSITAIQIVSRLSEKGLSIKIKDILTFHTIRQISRQAAFGSLLNTYPQGILEGTRGSTAIESWFFQQRFENPDHYNQSLLLRWNREIDHGLLQEAFRMLVEHHDGLRTNFDPAGQILFYNNEHLQTGFGIEEYELEAGADTGPDLIQLCQDIKSGFDIRSSLLLKAALIRMYNAPALLFITAHHLVIDGVSWRILLKDLYGAYTALENGKQVQFPPKTASLADCHRKLNDGPMSKKWEAEKNYWDRICDVEFRIPLDHQTEDWKMANLARVSGMLNEERTERLLKRISQVYKTDFHTLLSTVLVLTLKEWTDSDRFVIEFEGHGRHVEDFDTSCTVGWLTAMYPVLLEWNDGPLIQQIKSMKEQIRNIPQQGVGYGSYRLRQTLPRRDEGKLTEIRFNYLGQFEKEFGNDLFTYAHQSHGNDVDPRNQMTAKLELNSMIIGGIFRWEINYNRKAHREETMIGLNDRFLCHLGSVLEHLENEGDMHFTPSDFGIAAVGQEELDTLFR